MREMMEVKNQGGQALVRTEHLKEKKREEEKVDRVEKNAQKT